MQEGLEGRGEAPGRAAPSRQPHLMNAQASESYGDFRKALISEDVDGRHSSLWLYYWDAGDVHANLTNPACRFSLELQPAGGNETSARQILGTLNAPVG